MWSDQIFNDGLIETHYILLDSLAATAIIAELWVLMPLTTRKGASSAFNESFPVENFCYFSNCANLVFSIISRGVAQPGS